MIVLRLSLLPLLHAHPLPNYKSTHPLIYTRTHAKALLHTTTHTLTETNARSRSLFFPHSLSLSLSDSLSVSLPVPISLESEKLSLNAFFLEGGPALTVNIHRANADATSEVEEGERVVSVSVFGGSCAVTVSAFGVFYIGSKARLGRKSNFVQLAQSNRFVPFCR